MTKGITLIRTIYIYLFSLVGLVLVIIAGVRFIDMGLKAWVFTQAEQEQYMYNEPPRVINSIGYERAVDLEARLDACDDACELTQAEQTAIDNWIVDYEKWQTQGKEVNYIIQQRHRDAANSLAMLIVGLPLYLYHWKLATRKKEEETGEKTDDDMPKEPRNQGMPQV